MLSRVANSIYWMARYIERAENAARFVDVNLNMLLDLPGGHDQWSPLVNITGDHEPFHKRYGEDTQENVIGFLTFDTENPNSILSCLRAARENARTIREVISSEMWEQVNTFYQMVEAAARRKVLETPSDFFTEIKQASHLFNGITNATMSHGEAWNFCRAGRMLERADQTTRLIDMKYFILLPDVQDVGTAYDDIQWAAVLRSASGFQMYRKRFGRIDPKRIIEFLLLDRHFPRAVHYCLVQADESLHAVTGTETGSFTNSAEQQLGNLRAHFAFSRVGDIIVTGMHEYLDSIQGKLNKVDEAIRQTFFDFQPTPSSISQASRREE